MSDKEVIGIFENPNSQEVSLLYDPKTFRGVFCPTEQNQYNCFVAVTGDAEFNRSLKNRKQKIIKDYEDCFPELYEASRKGNQELAESIFNESLRIH